MSYIKKDRTVSFWRKH